MQPPTQRVRLGAIFPTTEIGDDPAAIRDWVQAAERRKLGLTDRPRASRKRPARERTIPNAVKRAVHERDGGRCTFVGEDGQRCEAQELLEFDHVTPVSRGGESTTANLRLRCRTHNQYEAERAFGAGFMERKRAEARRRAEQKRIAAQARAAESERRARHARELAANAPARERALDAMPWLREVVPPPARPGREGIINGSPDHESCPGHRL
jgi:5-methylcytosine-specific restriction endonuclease McrA